MTQMQHMDMERKRLADRDKTFIELWQHPTNPITRAELARLIEKRPEVWGPYRAYLADTDHP